MSFPTSSRRRAVRAGRAPGLRLGAVIFALAVLPGSEAGAQSDPSQRAVLVELFGATDCADCLPYRAAFDRLEIELDPVRVLVVEHFGAADPALASSASLARIDYYGAPAIPTAMFDGGVPLAGAQADPEGDARARLTARLAGGSPLALEALHAFDAATGEGEITIDVFGVDGETVPDPGEWRVRAFVVENGVPGSGPPGGTGSWDRVVRAAVPERDLAVTAGGEHQQIVLDLLLDPEWNVDRLGVVAFVQRDSDRSVLNAVRALDAFSLQPVVADGIDPSRVRFLPPVPNPLRSVTRISFTLPDERPARVTVHDVQGRIVRVLTDDVRPRGLHPLFWNGTDWRGARMPDGVYFVRLSTPGGGDTLKLVVIH